MCGIIGYIGPGYSAQALEAGMSCIQHRGPDASGIFYEQGLSFGHKRLSILDLSELGNQPFFFENLVLIFNGELYNFIEVKQDLEKEGYTFVSSTDTEVLIKAFHLWGTACIHRFIGMFAFAVYDRTTQDVFLFRDRIGIKPLYYTVANGLAFGSELKALQPFISDRTIDKNALWDYFRYGYVTQNRSIFEQVKKLEPGYYLHYRNGTINLHQYWKLDEGQAEQGKTEKQWKEELHELMIDAFSKRMIADVPVGVFLSGGIDSSLVTAILQKHHGRIHTFTIGFSDTRFNEAPYARKVAEHLGTHHTEHILEAKQAYDLLTRFYDVYDEPFADSSGIPTTLISQIAKQAGIKVVLSADGGDELFGGYRHYQYNEQKFRQFKKIPSFLADASSHTLRALYKSKLLRNFYGLNLEHKVAALGEMINQKDMLGFYKSYIGNQSVDEIQRLINHDYKNNGPDYKSDNDLTSMMLWDLHNYLPEDLLTKVDRATMFNNIEGREPFLDHRLVEMAFRLPAEYKIREGKTKWILREILSDYMPRTMFERPKQGFSIPIFSWFSTQMNDMFEYYFSPERIRQVPVLNAEEVEHEYRKYKLYKKQGREYNIEKMWRILSFFMWWDKWYCRIT